MTTLWSVDLCSGWERVGSVQAFEFAGVERWLEAGEWSLSCAPQSIQWGNRLVGDELVSYVADDVDTIRLVRDGVIVYAGFVAVPASGTGGVERTADVNGSRLVWSGTDLWEVFRRRVAYPDPTTTVWSVSHDVRSGPASTVLAAYLYDNAGLGALEPRRIEDLTISDPVVGDVGEWSARLQPLDKLAARICTDAEIGMWMSVTFDGAITATLGLPRDLTGRYVLSDLGDFSTLRVRSVPATVTATIAGGQGAGVSRVFRSYDSGAVGIARVEEFSDQSNLSSAQELSASAKATTRLGSKSWSVYAEVTDEQAAVLAYGSALQLGDTISVQVAGVRYSVPVTAAQFEISASRQVVRPIFGAAAPNDVAGLIRDVSGLADRLDRDIA